MATTYYTMPSYYKALTGIPLYDRPSAVLGEVVGSITQDTIFEVGTKAKYAIKDKAYFFEVDGLYVSSSKSLIKEIDGIAYVAEAGDSFESIAEMFEVDIELLIEKNPLIKSVSAGDTMLIPV